jgi:hypothetical protein
VKLSQSVDGFTLPLDVLGTADVPESDCIELGRLHSMRREKARAAVGWRRHPCRFVLAWRRVPVIWGTRPTRSRAWGGRTLGVPVTRFGDGGKIVWLVVGALFN